MINLTQAKSNWLNTLEIDGTGAYLFPRLLLVLLLFTLIYISGCAAVGPNYVRKEPEVSGNWQADLRNGLSAKPVDTQILASWWTTLDDPVLSDLMARAVKGNLSLKEALARVREARASLGISQSSRFPVIDASANATKTRSSGNSGSGSERELYAVGFDAGWELDIFGGVRRSIEAAEAELQSTQADLGDVMVSLLAEVALNYVEARAYQGRMALTEATIKSRDETFQLILLRFQVGLSDDLEVQQARYNLANARSQMPALRTGFKEANNRLVVLLGEQPGAVLKQLEDPKPIPTPPLEVAVGVPANTLRRRPDVYQAERQLAEQTAKIGVATADRYPKFSLNGSIGVEALSSGSLFSGGSRTYSYGPKISWALFDSGAIRRNIEVQSALQEQKLFQYESAVLTALEEVENALVAFAEEQVSRASLQEAAQAAQQAAQLSQMKFNAGLVDFSDVLETQRSLLSFENQLVQSEGAVTSNLIRLYKSLGGGWVSLALNMSEEDKNGWK